MLDDLVAVIIGCDQLMVLQPMGSEHFQVVGPCFVHGIMDAEGLLDPITKSWQLQRRILTATIYPTSFILAEERSRSKIHDFLLRRSNGNKPRQKRTSDDLYSFVEFRNTLTGEVINSDLKMLPKALEKRGVTLQTFRPHLSPEHEVGFGHGGDKEHLLYKRWKIAYILVFFGCL